MAKKKKGKKKSIPKPEAKKKAEVKKKNEKVLSRSINVHVPVFQRFLRLRALAQEKTNDYEMTRNGFVEYLLDQFEKGKGGK